MRKTKNIISIIIIWLLRRGSQIIFSVLYSPYQPSHAGIWSGSWTQHITQTGFFYNQLIAFTSSKPLPITTGLLDNYNESCAYGIWDCHAFWWQRLYSAFSRLTIIQYIGKDVDITQPSDITNRFHHLHSLNPNRRYPHLFAQYIWPSSKKSDTNTTWWRITRENTVKIGEAGIRYSCDMNKIKKISDLTYTEFLQAIADHNPAYRYPCTTDELAHALAFNYYHYLDNVEKSSLYYMVASFHDETPKITLSMPAIIQWREWNNKVSSFLRYDRLQNNYKELKKKDLPDDKRKQIEDNVSTALKKMVSEFSMHILTQATKLATEKKANNNCIHSTSCLKSNGYLSTIISQIQSSCTTDTVSCEILSIGQESNWIKSNGNLIHPDPSTTYTRKEKENLWWVSVK